MQVQEQQFFFGLGIYENTKKPRPKYGKNFDDKSIQLNLQTITKVAASSVLYLQ